MAYVYIHKTLDTNVIFYVGIGSDKNYKRAHFFKNRSKIWTNIYNKHRIAVEIVCDNLSWADACTKEIELIKKYGRRDLREGTLVNMTDGGEGLFNPSAEVRNKLRYEKSEEHKEKLRTYRLGVKQSKEIIEKRLSHGFHQTNEYKEKQRQSHMGKTHSESSKNKMRKPKPPRSIEHCKKISDSKKGKAAHNKGAKQSQAWLFESEIKQLRLDGWSIEQLRKRFHCGERTILRILSN
jgi:hypothetical protein